ncbi:putative polysaccharide biosynthesis protein [Hutsoniella sourekii]
MSEQETQSGKSTGRKFDQTIQFTAEDLKKIREQSRVNLDDDYFDRSQPVHPSHHQEVLEDQLQGQKSAQADLDQARQQVEEEMESLEESQATQGPVKTVKRRKPVSQEAYFDMDHLEPMSAYDEFSGDLEGVDYYYEEVEVKPSLWQRLKAKFTSKASDSEERGDLDQGQADLQAVYQEPTEEQEAFDTLEADSSTVDLAPALEADESDDYYRNDQVYQETYQETLEAIEENEGEAADDLTAEEEAEVYAYSQKLSHETQSFAEPILTDTVLEAQSIHSQEEQIDFPDLEAKDGEGEDHLVSGAAWISVGNIISRVLGALYVIPWATWMGSAWTEANSLMSIGYKPYSLFLSIATAGFPSAIAKQMAYYHSIKEYRAADRLFKNSSLIMLLTGGFSALLLFVLAPVLAAGSPTTNPEGATFVIRSLVPALLILPIMSLLRGYFQGFNDMKPTAISQIIEQIMRVVYMLVATYAIMQIYYGEVTNAVVHSTFAAFIGALASLLYLLFVYWRRLPAIRELVTYSRDRVALDFKQSLQIMVVDSIPFILLGSGIIIAQLMDTYTFSQILESSSALLLSEISELYGTLSLDVDKLSMIIISLAVSLATALVPTVTTTFASQDREGTGQIVEKILLIFSFVMLPASVGMATVADNVYQLFYPAGSAAGPALLVTASLSAIILGLYTVLSTILQSMNFRRKAVTYLVVGLLVKLVLQYPLVALLHAHGALLSTAIGFAVASGCMFVKLDRVLALDVDAIIKDFLRVLGPTLVMAIATFIWNNVLNMAFGPVGRGLTFLKILLVMAFGVLIYASLMGLQGMLSVILGDRFKDLQEKMKVF